MPLHFSMCSMWEKKEKKKEVSTKPNLLNFFDVTSQMSVVLIATHFTQKLVAQRPDVTWGLDSHIFLHSSSLVHPLVLSIHFFFSALGTGSLLACIVNRVKPAAQCPRVHCVFLWCPAGCFEMISQFMILLFNKSLGLPPHRPNTEAPEEKCCCVGLCSGPCALWARGRCRDKKVWAEHRRRGDRGSGTWQQKIHLD